MTYEQFKKQHDKLLTELIFSESSNQAERVERVERLRADNPKYWDVLWGDL